MPEAYALCASALVQLTSDGGKKDGGKKDKLSPNALVAALFEILYGNALSAGATAAASRRQQTLALVLPRAVAGQGEDSWDAYDFSPLVHRLGRPNAVMALLPVFSRGQCNGILLAVIRGHSARITMVGDESTSAAVKALSKELVGLGITATTKSQQTHSSSGACTLLQIAARVAVDLSPDLSRPGQAPCDQLVQAIETWARREAETAQNERAVYLRSMSGTGGKPKPKARTIKPNI